MIRQEMEILKKQVADLVVAQNNDRDLIREVYTNTYQYIADIHDYLWPVVHKLFPHFAEGKKQIDAFTKGRSTTDGNKKNS